MTDERGQERRSSGGFTIAVVVAIVVAALVIGFFLGRSSEKPSAVSAPRDTSKQAVPTTPAVTNPAPGAQPSNALERLQMREDAQRAPGYSRDLFPTWLDLDGNGCNARHDVLRTESLIAPEVSGPCKVVSGKWFSLYDGTTLTSAADVEVDHVVALADAWRSGASGWLPERRVAFANDLTYEDHLMAVSSASNSAKSDKAPDQWRPANRAAWCRYATAWTNVKVTWGLSATRSERDALGQMLETCPQ